MLRVCARPWLPSLVPYKKKRLRWRAEVPSGPASSALPTPWVSLQGVLASLAYQRYKVGVDDFIQNYVDPTPDPSTAYASYPSASVENYQQPPFTQNAETTEGYQPPVVY